MSDTQEKVNNLKEILKLVNSGLTRKEFTDAFQVLFNRLQKLEQKLTTRIDSKTDTALKDIQALKDNLQKVIDKAENDSSTALGSIRQRISDRIDNAFAKSQVNSVLKKATKDVIALENKLASKIEEIDNKLALVKSGEDGRDADEDLVIETVTEKLKELIPEVKDEDILNKVAELEIIKELIRKIEFLEERLTRVSAGGVSNLRIQQAFKYILKTEQPSGAINGSNTAYTVSQPIFAILAFSLNGEVIAELPNYTISDRTITFSSALPAAYSGKDFEVKYV